jgi:hypothetical protein
MVVRRGKDYLTGKYDAPFPSCSPLLFNGIPFFSRKGEILKRFHINTFSEEDRHDRSPNSPFNTFHRQNKDKLKILGDWTMRYIYEHRQELPSADIISKFFLHVFEAQSVQSLFP